MDDFDKVYISHEDSQAIIDWALAAAAMVHIIHDFDENIPSKDRMDAVKDGIEVMVERMPVILYEKSAVLATESVRAYVEEEEAVEEFREELKGL